MARTPSLNESGHRRVPKDLRSAHRAPKQQPMQRKQPGQGMRAQQSAGRISLWLNFGLR